jgi:hypothetical protein
MKTLMRLEPKLFLKKKRPILCQKNDQPALIANDFINALPKKKETPETN